MGYQSVDTSAPVRPPPELLRAGPYSSSLPAKIAFLFLTVGPMPLIPLWNKFFQVNPRALSNSLFFTIELVPRL